MTQNDREIDRAAAEWAVLMNERELTLLEQQRLDAWLGANVRHQGALLRAQAVWSDLDRLAALAGHPDVRVADPERESTRADVSPPSSLSALSISEPRPTRRWLLAAGLSSVFLGTTGGWWVSHRNKTYVSRLGEIQRVILSDGSQMVLNTSSAATVHFDRARREIELASGEGLFQVAKDPARPFVVRTGSLSVRAVGTVFTVSTDAGRVDVTVSEGIVELVDESIVGGGVIRRIAANEHASIMETRQVEVQSLPQGEAVRRLAWRDGMVEFAGQPLGKAVEQMNRHNHRQIVIDAPELATRSVVGLFRATDPDNFALTVAAAFGARAVDRDGAIHLQLPSTL